jgi:hypothetical protein
MFQICDFVSQSISVLFLNGLTPENGNIAISNEGVTYLPNSL